VAYSEYLADRVRNHFTDREDVEEKKMMGGLVFMVDDKMCIGVKTDKESGGDRLMVRLDKNSPEDYLARKGCHPMDMTGKKMAGFYYIFPEGYEEDSDLAYWVKQALEFNPLATRSKSRKKK